MKWNYIENYEDIEVSSICSYIRDYAYMSFGKELTFQEYSNILKETFGDLLDIYKYNDSVERVSLIEKDNEQKDFLINKMMVIITKPTDVKPGKGVYISDSRLFEIIILSKLDYYKSILELSDDEIEMAIRVLHDSHLANEFIDEYPDSRIVNLLLDTSLQDTLNKTIKILAKSDKNFKEYV